MDIMLMHLSHNVLVHNWMVSLIISHTQNSLFSAISISLLEYLRRSSVTPDAI